MSRGQKPLAMVITAGQRGDSAQFVAVLAAIRVPVRAAASPAPARLSAGRQGVTSKANRDYLRGRRIKATIPSKAGQDAHRRAKGSKGGRPPTFDREVYQQRHAVE